MKKKREDSDHYYKDSKYYPGKEGYAGMPSEAHVGQFPDHMQSYPALDDTISGVDKVQEESYRKTHSHLSDQK